MNTPSPITALLLANVVANVVADVIATDAFAQAAPAQGAPGFGEMLTSMLPMFAIVFLIFYTLVFKPQQKKVKEQQDLLTNLKKGDSVITSSGIYGRVASIETGYLMLEIAPNLKIKIEKAHVLRKEDKEKEAAKSAA